MSTVQSDLVGIKREFAGESAEQEFLDIFAFSPDVIRSAAMRALRAANETSNIHAPANAAGSIFYQYFLEGARSAIDTQDGWSAQRKDDNRTAPRVYSDDGMVLAFVQGNDATGVIGKALRLKRKLGNVTKLELLQCVGEEQQIFPIDEVARNMASHEQMFWLIVYRRERDAVRIEMALPAGVEDDGTIIGWDKRIVLEDVTMNDQSMEVVNDERAEDDDITVAISER